jgi:hypothetical protein
MKKTTRVKDWVRYDRETETLSVTNSEGKTCIYAKGNEVLGGGSYHIELTFDGNVIEVHESSLRSLPERIVVKRLAETNPLFGTPVRGAHPVRFEYVRRD